MDFTQITAIILLLIASMCRGEIVTKASEWEQSMARLGDVLVNIITSCHKGRVNGVGLAGNLPSTLYRTLSVQHSIPTVVFPNFGTYSPYSWRPVPDKFKQPLNLFIVEAENYAKLYTIFRTVIRRSIWSNHMASVFIIDVSRECAEYKDLLWSAWTFDLLHAQVLCRRHKSGRIMFSFNPFTSKAPSTWQRDSVIIGRNDHPFTIFSRESRENETLICEDIIFDKMADLGGVPIGIKGYREDYSQKTTNTHGLGAYAFETRRRSILGTLLLRLNASVIFIDPVSGSFQAMNAEPDGLQFTWLSDLKLTYPHRQVKANIITHFRGHKSEPIKILSVIHVDSPFGMGGAYLIILMAIKIFAHQIVVPALRNLIRTTCKTALVNWANNNASRIALGCILFFAVTTQTIFQGYLASRLTKTLEVPLRNVESIQDLEDMGYTKICGKKYYRTYFEGSKFEKNFIVNDDERDCIMRVKNDLSTAYIGRSESFIIDMVENFNLHISKKPVEMIYMGFPIYREWAMEDRTNAIISRMVEANGLEIWETKGKPIELRDSYMEPMVRRNLDFKKLELHELMFAIVILTIGLVCATIVFVIELLMRFKCIYRIIIWRDGKTWNGRVVEGSPEVCLSSEELPEVCLSSEELPEVCLSSEDLPEVCMNSDDIPEVCRSLEDLPEVCLSSEVLPEVCLNLDDLPEVCRSLEGLPEVCRRLEGLPEVYLNLEDSPEVCPSTEGSSAV